MHNEIIGNVTGLAKCPNYMSPSRGIIRANDARVTRDLLFAGNGNDNLKGGAGADKFAFKTAQNCGADSVITWANGQITLLHTAETQISTADSIFV